MLGKAGQNQSEILRVADRQAQVFGGVRIADVLHQLSEKGVVIGKLAARDILADDVA